MYCSLSKSLGLKIKFAQFSCRNCSSGFKPPLSYNKLQEVYPLSEKHLSDRLVSAGNSLSIQVTDHVFYAEIFDGVLCPSRYQQFIIQDIFYLQGRLKALEIAQGRFSNHLSLFSDLTVRDKLELKKIDAFQSHFEIKSSISKMNLACQNYVTFLNSVVERQSLEEFIAALLSCLWVFQKIATVHAHRVEQIDCNHSYFHFLKDLKAYLISSSMHKLLLILYAEINLKTVNEQEIFLPQIIEAFIRGLQFEIEFLDSFYK